MSLVALGLEPLLGRVGVVDGLEVESSLGADRLEDDGALLGGDLAVGLVLDDESRDILDDGADGLDVALGVLDDDPDLGAGNAEAPEALAVAVDEASEGGLNLFEVEAETVEEVELLKKGSERSAKGLSSTAKGRRGSSPRCGFHRRRGG